MVIKFGTMALREGGIAAPWAAKARNDEVIRCGFSARSWLLRASPPSGYKKQPLEGRLVLVVILGVAEGRAGFGEVGGEPDGKKRMETARSLTAVSV